MTERITERIEGLLRRVPGYTGYRQKESMRDDDRRLREEIARSLDQATSQLSSLGSTLAGNRQLSQVSTVEDTIGRVRHLANRVRSATYGYGGIFSDRNVDQYALQQLKQFDVAFQARVDELAGQIASAASGDVVDTEAFGGIDRTVADLNTLFDSRGDVIETATPTEDPNVLALLEAPRVLSPQERQLLNIRKGGTGAILGDNYQFTSHVVLTSREGEPVLTMVELDGGPDWLAAVDTGAAVEVYRVQQADATVADAGQPASASVAGPQGTQRDVPASFAVTPASSENGMATISVTLAGNNRAYQGTSVPLIDLQVFSEGNVA